MSQRQHPLQFLAIGDSLTAGYYNRGLSYHSYANNLSYLFSSVRIPIIVHEHGVGGEQVVPIMRQRLETLLLKKGQQHYDWILILGGTNDLRHRSSAERIFKQGLEPMYDMVLHHKKRNTKLVVMTVLENGSFSPKDDCEKHRQDLNDMIRNYVINHNDPDRVCLVDLDKGIPYHRVIDKNKGQSIWDDMIHLTPAGYDQMAKLIFEAVKKKLTK